MGSRDLWRREQGQRRLLWKLGQWGKKSCWDAEEVNGRMTERLHLQLLKLYIYTCNWWKFYKALWIQLLLKCFKHMIRNYFIKEHFKNLMITTVWGSCHVFFLTVSLPVSVEKASLHVKNIAVFVDLHRKITEEVKKVAKHKPVHTREIVSWTQARRRRVRATSWLWRQVMGCWNWPTLQGWNWPTLQGAGGEGVTL